MTQAPQAPRPDLGDVLPDITGPAGPYEEVANFTPKQWEMLSAHLAADTVATCAVSLSFSEVVRLGVMLERARMFGIENASDGCVDYMRQCMATADEAYAKIRAQFAPAFGIRNFG